MSFRHRLLSILDVVLRVPPMFVMDSLIISGFGSVPKGDSSFAIKVNASESASLILNSSAETGEFDPIGESYYLFTGLTEYFGWLCICFNGFLLVLSIFLLSTQHLISLYVWLASIGVIIWSYICNEEYIKYVTKSNSSTAFELLSLNLSTALRFFGNYFLQVFLAILFCFASMSTKNLLPKRLVGLFFIMPTVLSLLPGVPSSLLMFTPIVAASVALFHVFLNFVSQTRYIAKSIYEDVQLARNIVRNFGIYTLLENQWIRLHVPQVLRVFWLTRLTEQAVLLIADSAHQNYLTSGIFKLSIDTNYLLISMRELLVRGCETVIAVLGMTSVLSSLSHQVGCFMQSFLLVEDPEDRSIGTVSAILFFILALQTGLTGMEPEKRFLRLYRNLCLLFTAILHFIHNMVNPLLFSLSASRNMSLNRHGRALLVCFFLIAFPCLLLFYLWTHHSISTWLLAVSAFSIEVVIKVVISLLIYGLFMIDAFRTTVWEQLDDYVYYIRAAGNTIEFVFGIFLFFNGAWILLFESGGTIRALMMCIHAYFNIWLQAKAGWETFMKRRMAVYRIASLAEASPEQLRDFDDVCAICYQELANARITTCNHYFHGMCLRKWLYVQDICPLCHHTLYIASDENVGAEGRSGEVQAQQPQPNQPQQQNQQHEHQD